jgi:hypothetical protein
MLFLSRSQTSLWLVLLGACAPTGEGPEPDAAGLPPDASASDAGSGASDAASEGDEDPEGARFSFFVTSLSAMRTLSKSQTGFGGDLRYGETGDGAGLRGADKICAEAAEMGLPGAGQKQWRAFLSTTTGNAKDRIGTGPWYDRQGRLVAMTLADLLTDRPSLAHVAIRADLPNERGEPNKAGSAEGGNDDNHDVVTASNGKGIYAGGTTCEDWTSITAVGNPDDDLLGMKGPVVGHSWPAFSGVSWSGTHRAPGCAPSVALVQTGMGSGDGIGNSGGYGAIYCFALSP